MSAEKLAKEIRLNILRAILKSKASHIASAMSIVDILAVLYSDFISPEKIQFILSKGHAGVAVYSTLRAIGVIDEEMFATYYANGSYLGGHVSHKNVPGIYLSTGSLGGGVSVASGIALANKLDGNNENVYTIIGDGECGEGSIWEGALFAAHHKLNNLTVIIDRNFLQGCGTDKDILSLDSLSNKWRSFNWHVLEVDGHNYTELTNALKSINDLPRCIIANTVKGSGFSFMENNNLWHYRNISEDDYKQALIEMRLD